MRLQYENLTVIGLDACSSRVIAAEDLVERDEIARERAIFWPLMVIMLL